MKFTKILAMLSMAAILFTGCKKDDAGSNGFTLDDNGNVTVGPDADGAMYSIMIKTFNGTSGTTFDQSEYVTAWYGNAMSPVDAGVVKANDVELMNFGSGFYWYTQFGFAGDIFTNGNNVTWNVGGAGPVAAFTYLDANPFPGGATFSLPGTININNNFTLNHAATTGADAVIYQVIGNNGEVHKSVMGASSSVTFTSAEMKQVSDGGGDPIGFMVMPVSVRNSAINGKNYYFVKQYEVLRETITQ